MRPENQLRISRKELSDKFILPGFNGVPLNHVLQYLKSGFRKGMLVTRASSLAFNMLLALLPALIFIFTLIPFIPLANFQEEILRLFENIMPENVFGFLRTTIIDVVTKKSGGLLFFMFIATVVLSTNGIHAVIHSFVVSAHSFKTRSWLNQRKIAFVLLLVIILMISTAGFLLIFGKMALKWMMALHFIEKNLLFYLLVFLKWVLIFLLLFFAISSLYYLAPAKRSGFKFFSPGSILATFLFILTSLGFSAYVNHFGQYNKLYGSIGTLMVTLIWLYFNSIAVLIGFELNLSIIEARAELDQRFLTINRNAETA